MQREAVVVRVLLLAHLVMLLLLLAILADRCDGAITSKSMEDATRRRINHINKKRGQGNSMSRSEGMQDAEKHFGKSAKKTKNRKRKSPSDDMVVVERKFSVAQKCKNAKSQSSCRQMTENNRSPHRPQPLDLYTNPDSAQPNSDPDALWEIYELHETDSEQLFERLHQFDQTLQDEKRSLRSWMSVGAESNHPDSSGTASSTSFQYSRKAEIPSLDQKQNTVSQTSSRSSPDVPCSSSYEDSARKHSDVSFSSEKRWLLSSASPECAMREANNLKPLVSSRDRAADSRKNQEMRVHGQMALDSLDWLFAYQSTLMFICNVTQELSHSFKMLSLTVPLSEPHVDSNLYWEAFVVRRMQLLLPYARKFFSFLEIFPWNLDRNLVKHTGKLVASLETEKKVSIVLLSRILPLFQDAIITCLNQSYGLQQMNYLKLVLNTMFLHKQMEEEAPLFADMLRVQLEKNCDVGQSYSVVMNRDVGTVMVVNL